MVQQGKLKEQIQKVISGQGQGNTTGVWYDSDVMEILDAAIEDFPKFAINLDGNTIQFFGDFDKDILNWFYKWFGETGAAATP